MHPVVSTYRLQFSPSFTFRDAGKIAGYLDELGISHVYASPIFEAMPGSEHGYDVTDFGRIRAEIGGESGCLAIIEDLGAHSIGWIQDFVPNHMAMHPFNPYIHDVLKNGTESKYSRLFDIDWDHPAFGHGRLSLPFLANPYEEELQNGKFAISKEDGYSIVYDGLSLPLRESSQKLLSGKLGSADSDWSKSLSVIPAILAEQYYRLKYWRSSASEINYRRFFAVNGLIGLREEDWKVFDIVHEKLFDLVGKGYIDGVRIDHIDGIYNPRKYLEALRKSIDQRFLLVEKILQCDEHLDESWAVEGTTGYDFLARVTGVLCSERGINELTGIYDDFVGGTRSGESAIHDSKMEVIDELFQGVVQNLSRQILSLVDSETYGKDLSLPGMVKAISELFARMPVYRTYVEPENSSHEIQILKSVINKIRLERADLVKEMNALDLFISNHSDNEKHTDSILRLQQYMPAVFAKGVEDRILFRYNRLISLNEVGSDPYAAKTSIDEFHKFNQTRQKRWPHTMNALSTHDTKMSEDIRGRISVISEMPEEWHTRITMWRDTNRGCSKIYGEKICPSANEEYYLYQLLLGSYPFQGGHSSEYSERVTKHFLKSIREAGMNSGWNDPDLGYEEGCKSYVLSVLDREKNTAFWQDFEVFGKIIAFHGGINSLSQKVLQMTCPGIPDTYQGTEVLRYNFIDPDNRRQVDFNEIIRLFDQLRERSVSFEELVRASTCDLDFGALKLLITHKLLILRKQQPELFLQGSYEPLEVSGEHRENLIAFLRESEGMKVLVLVPRLTTLLGTLRMPIGKTAWQDTGVLVPAIARGLYTDILTGRRIELQDGQLLHAADVLNTTPFSILFADH